MCMGFYFFSLPLHCNSVLLFTPFLRKTDTKLVFSLIVEQALLSVQNPAKRGMGGGGGGGGSESLSVYKNLADKEREGEGGREGGKEL